jgi:hypothetical protein
LPKELARIKGLIERGLERTAGLWPQIQAAYDQVWGVARILDNESWLSGAGVSQALKKALAGMAPRKGQSPWLKEAFAAFRKVSASYWPGLFHCYEVEGLGRTNNDLEQFFGSWRWHERRCSGRKVASRSDVLLGPASLASSLASRQGPVSGEDLAGVDLERWRQIREEIVTHQKRFRQRRAFRRNPDKYLGELTARTIKLLLPS